MSVCVIGAGVIGLSTAVAIQDRLPNARITLVADKFDRHTTSFGSGGMVVPTERNIRGEIGREVCEESAKYFTDLAFSPLSKDSGVSLVSGLMLTNRDTAPDIVKHALSVHKMEPALQQRFDKHYKNGYTFVTSRVDMPSHLDWLMKRFRAKGGMTEKRTVKSLEELSGRFQLVVNCSGIGSRELVPDTALTSYRGQTVHVKAPWIKTNVYCDDNVQIFPTADTVYVGGVKQSDRYDTGISKEDTDRILTRAQAIFPPLQGAEVQFEWAGLRPQRETVRLEQELMSVQGRPLQVIHNYGHGSLGVSLSPGCALRVARMAETLLQRHPAKL